MFLCEPIMIHIQYFPSRNVPITKCLLQNVPLRNVPLRNVPLRNVPLRNVPLQNVPLRNVPLRYVPLRNILLKGHSIEIFTPLFFLLNRTPMGPSQIWPNCITLGFVFPEIYRILQRRVRLPAVGYSAESDSPL